MTKTKKLVAVVAPVMAVSLALTACGGGEKKNTSKEGEKSEGKLAAKQVLHLLDSAEIPSMDSVKADDSASFDVMNNVMEGLYRLDKDQKLVPGVAEDMKISDDKLKYTFKLRKDAKWSNGDPVTAKDFVFAWRRAADPATKAVYAMMMYNIKNGEEINNGKMAPDQLGVKAVDDYTLEVELAAPTPYFDKLTTFGTFYPQNEKFVKAQGDKYALEANTGVYNGPFVLSEWKHEQSYQLKKNDKYWDNKNVKLEEIDFNIVKDTGTAVNLYEAGEVDRASLVSEFVDKYKSNPAFKTDKTSSVFFLRMNQKRKGQDLPFANKKVRQAVAMAFDKDALTSQLLNDGSVTANALVPEGLVQYKDGKDFRKTGGDLLKYDNKKAKTLWEEAKKELGKDKITLELLTTDSTNTKKVGEYLKEQLEKNLPGLTVVLKQQPFKQKNKLEQDNDYDFVYSGWGPDYPDPMTFIDMFATGDSHNEMSYSNKDYDQIVKDGKGKLLSDPEKRLKELAKAEKILLDDAAIAPMFQSGKSYLLRPTVQGIATHQFGGEHSYKWAYLTEGK